MLMKSVDWYQVCHIIHAVFTREMSDKLRRLRLQLLRYEDLAGPGSTAYAVVGESSSCDARQAPRRSRSSFARDTRSLSKRDCPLLEASLPSRRLQISLPTSLLRSCLHRGLGTKVSVRMLAVAGHQLINVKTPISITVLDDTSD